MQIKETALSGGLTVITANLPGFESAAVAATVRAGSRDETVHNNGVAHLLEHMAFKGTQSRSALDIALEIEVLGASINAFTSQEQTTYYVSGLKHTVPDAVNILADVLTDSRFAASDLDVERGVISQEIARSLDDPNGLAMEGFNAAAYADQPLGRTVLGQPDFIGRATRDDLIAFVNDNYHARNMVLVATGAIDHDWFLELVGRRFAAIPDLSVPSRALAHYVGGMHRTERSDFKQVNVYLGFPSVPLGDDAYAAHRMLALALGYGMSSPLFQEVREKRGLAYAVGATSVHGTDFGHLVTYGGMTPEKLERFLLVVCQELLRCTSSIGPSDLERARNVVLAHLATVRERPFNLAFYLSHQFFRFGHAIGPDIDIEAVRRVRLEDLPVAARQVLAGAPTISLVGPVPEADYLAIVRESLQAVQPLPA
jgi:predicted Zn-dependent peptidase